MVEPDSQLVSPRPFSPDPVGTIRRGIFRYGKFALKAVVFVLIGWGLWHTLSQAQGQLAAEGISLQKLQYRWLVIAAALYCLGMLPCSLFWHRVMDALQQRVPRLDAITAFFVSQLGKYVPGKFMVLVLRTAGVRQYDVNKTLTVASIFVETLTMMSVGAMLGAVMLALAVTSDWRLMLFAMTAAACVGAPTLPPVFRRLVMLTKLHRRHPEIDQALAGLNWQMLWPNWLSIGIGWCAIGLSLWAVLKALPGVDPPPALPQDLPVLIACVTLSTVAGFVSGLPGGLIARELVVMQLVQPHFGLTAAVSAAIVHRCVMLATEMIAAALLFAVTAAWRRRQ